jgi:peptidyl-prolyl cis-trans isomerase SurA
MKRKFRLLSPLLGLLSITVPLNSAFAQVKAPEAPTASANGIAAQVEDRIITLEELRREVAPLVPQIRAASATRGEFDRHVAEVTREILQAHIDRILVIRAFEQDGMQIPPTYIENAYDDHLTTQFGGDRAAFLNDLKAKGMTDLDFREQLREKIVVDFMRSQHMRSRVSVSPERVLEYYQQNQNRFTQEAGVKLSMIVLKPKPAESQSLLEQRTQQVMQKLNSGESFASVAQAFSDGENASKGGDWGWVDHKVLKDDLSEAAFALEPGTYTQPLISGPNRYVLYVEDKREAGVKSIDRVRSEIEEAIAARIARQETNAWLDGLREDAYINIYLRDVETLMHGNEPENTVQMSLGKQPG